MRTNGIVCAGLFALATVALVSFPDSASAQRRRGGVSVGVGTDGAWVGYGSGGYYNPYYSNYYSPYGWGWSGYSSPYYSSYYSPYWSGYSSPYYSTYNDFGPTYYSRFGRWAGSFNGMSAAAFGYAFPEYYTPGQATTVTSTTSAYEPSDQMPANDKAYVMIQVPSDSADVWIQGQKSHQDQARQDYVSPQLTPGKKYFYEIRAQWKEGDRTIDETRNFAILPGRPVVVDFTQPLPNQQRAAPQERTAPAPREELPKPKQ